MKHEAPNHSKRCGSTWGWTCWRCRELLCAPDSAEYERRRQHLFPAPAVLDFDYLHDARFLDTLAHVILANKSLFGPIVKQLAGTAAKASAHAVASANSSPTLEYLIPMEEGKNQ